MSTSEIRYIVLPGRGRRTQLEASELLGRNGLIARGSIEQAVAHVSGQPGEELVVHELKITGSFGGWRAPIALDSEKFELVAWHSFRVPLNYSHPGVFVSGGLVAQAL